MKGSISFHELSALAPDQRAALMVRTEGDLGRFVEQVRPIIDRVRREGDQALAELARELDGALVAPAAIKCRPEEFDSARRNLDAQLIASLTYAAENVRIFHQWQMPEQLRLTEVRPGVLAGEKITPIPSVACYVPRGKGAFPSCLLMTAIPARVAGVPRVMVVTPPGPDGSIDAATLVAARLAGVDEIYKCGGAQAVAAVAYGTQTVPRAAKIVGPGSPWVVAAKRLLADVIDPGPPAGPSEAIVLADETASSRVAALDLINESEHGPDSSAFLVTSSRRLAEEVRRVLPEYWKMMGPVRSGYSAAVLGGPRGGIVLAPDMEAAVDFANDYAPEHLLVLSRDPFHYLGRLVNAGEILLGEDTAIALGNYVLGPSHVLPTAGAARTWSPLSVFDFLKRTSVGYVTAQAHDGLARHAHVLAGYEGFEGHALAVSEARQTARRTA
ncbi:MAG: histidinol dehydrogenase [Thermodesulfobacteriota bacterium]